MTIEYQKTWEVMNQLEESFNKIAAVEFMVEELNDAVNQNETDRIVDISHALLAYLPVYISHYEKASRRAWNNTVVKVAEQDVPYRIDIESEDSIMFKYSDEDPSWKLYDSTQGPQTENSRHRVNSESG